MNVVMHTRSIMTAMVTGIIILIVGCAEMQTLVDSALPPIERVQRQLQSSDAQIRMNALSQITTTNDGSINPELTLKNVILGQGLRNHPDDYRAEKVNYSEDVRIGAASKLFERGKILSLINIADDDRIGGGKKAMISGDNPIVTHIKKMVRTIEGLEKLCAECSSLREKSDWIKESWFLIGDPEALCPLNNECLLWVVRHAKDRTITNIFDHKTGSAATAGVNAVKKMTDYGCLKTVATDTSCLIDPRITAAEKLFKHENINGDDILSVIASFEKADDEQMAQLAKAGIGAAKRIGAQNVINTLEGK